MLHRIRQAMSQAEQATPLAGTVKSIMKYYTQPYYSVYNNNLLKSPVIIAAQVDEDNGPQHLKFRQLSMDQLAGVHRVRQHGADAFVSEHVSPSACFHPIAVPYDHKKTPQICQEYRISRNWIIHTFHYIGPKYIQAYLNEYAFRRNRMLRSEPIETCLYSACVRYTRLPLDYYAPKPDHSARLQHPKLRNWVKPKSA